MRPALKLHRETTLNKKPKTFFSFLFYFVLVFLLLKENFLPYPNPRILIEVQGTVKCPKLSL